MKNYIENIDSLNIYELGFLYNKLKQERKSLIDDIKYTQNAIEDKYTNYVDLREYKNDLIAANMRINQIDGIIEKINKNLINKIPKEINNSINKSK